MSAGEKVIRERALSTPVLYMLLVLLDGARHGYAIKREVERRSGGTVRLGPGTLYEAVQRLESGGFIAELAAGSDTRRRTYRITEAGKAALREAARGLGRLIDDVRRHPALAEERP